MSRGGSAIGAFAGKNRRDIRGDGEEKAGKGQNDNQHKLCGHVLTRRESCSTDQQQLPHELFIVIVSAIGAFAEGRVMVAEIGREGWRKSEHDNQVDCEGINLLDGKGSSADQ